MFPVVGSIAYTLALGETFLYDLTFFFLLQWVSVNPYQSVPLKVTKISRHYPFIQHCLWPTLREEMFYHGWPTKPSELDDFRQKVLWLFSVTQRGVDVPHNWTSTVFYTVGWSVTLNMMLLFEGLCVQMVSLGYYYYFFFFTLPYFTVFRVHENTAFKIILRNTFHI